VLVFAITDVAQAKNTTLGERIVRQHLRDPDSARFRNVFSSQGFAATCGEVNARNGFGGYTGFSKFVADHKDSSVYFESKLGVLFQDVWTEVCKR
jgi:hypothetical protein